MKKKRLGISLYPEKCTDGQCFDYMEKAASHGFDVLFLALFMSNDSREEIIRRYLPITTRAKELGFEIHADVNPAFLRRIGAKFSLFDGFDLSFFTDLKIDAMRLDAGMSEMEEAQLSKNKDGIKIVLNGCSEADHIGSVLVSGGDPDNLIGCYNYYPHRFTGITTDYFNKCGRHWMDRKLRLQTFVTSQASGAFGPWPVDDGIPTLESHRTVPISTQMKHYAMMPGITDVIISNCFATEDELAAVEAANTDIVKFHVTLADGLPQEQERLLRTDMSVRFDCVCEYLARSMETRMLRAHVEPFNCTDIRRGDVLIDNDRYGSYQGEVQIALRDMPGHDRTNVVAHIDEDEHMLLQYLKAGMRFGFTW